MNKKKLCIFIWLAVMIGTVGLGISAIVSEGFHEEDALSVGLGIIVFTIAMMFIMIPEVDILLGIINFDWKQRTKRPSAFVANIISVITSAITLVLFVVSFLGIKDINSILLLGLMGSIILCRIIFLFLK